jgi:lysophospholipase L1-like esterase
MRPRRLARTVIGGLVAGLLLSVAPVPLGTATAAAPPLPTRLASLGDSITRGFNACGFYVDCPSRSWSTGSSSAVRSHYLRVLAGNPAAVGHNVNAAETGARMADLAGQAAAAVAARPDYVTVLIGANDACTGSEATMTPVATFTEAFRSALATLAAGAPDARVFVASVPDVNRLWQVGKGSLAARTAWSLFGICQSLLARPLSTRQADVDRRARVHQRVVDYNAALAGVCATFAFCRFDGNAVFGYPFVLGQVSTWDYFHPNTSGQAALAEVTWQRSYWATA